MDANQGKKFWGLEVKAGESLMAKPDEGFFIHISQAILDQGNKRQSGHFYTTFEGQKIVIGAFLQGNIQMSLDLVFGKDFQLSHNFDTGSVHFTGYQSPIIKPEELPTMEDILAIFCKWQEKSNSRLTTSKNSWRDRRPNRLPKHINQTRGNCWAIAFYRQWYVLMKLNGLSTTKLTVAGLSKGVPMCHQGPNGGLTNIEHGATFMREKGYVDEITVHYKPKEDSDGEEFELFLENLVYKAPCAVLTDHFDSYERNRAKGHILKPNYGERLRRRFEKPPGLHVSLLVGHGVDYVGEVAIEYWEVFESRGCFWGDSGFVKYARHEGLIDAAVEMKMTVKEVNA